MPLPLPCTTILVSGVGGRLGGLCLETGGNRRRPIRPRVSSRSGPCPLAGASMQSLAGVLLPALVAILAARATGRVLTGVPGRHLLQEEVEDRRYNYQHAGTDWPDQYPECGGSAQSPINIDTSDVEDSNFQEVTARFDSFGVGRKVSVLNTGQAVEVTWEESDKVAVFMPVVGDIIAAAVDPLDPNHDDKLDLTDNGTFSYHKVELKQFHFHISSENAIDGLLYPMEAHLVTQITGDEVPACGERGCTVVFAILFKLDEDVNFFLEPFLDAAPERHGHEFMNPLPEGFDIDFDELIPNKRSFYTWTGSFTTPPCTEGVTWVLFDHFGKISQGQLTLLQSKMSAARETCKEEAHGDVEKMEECAYTGDLKNNRAVQPLNSRRVVHVQNSIVTT